MIKCAYFRIAAIASCGFTLAPWAQAQSPSSAVAVVNGQAIYDADLTGAAEAQLRQLRTQEYEIKKGALETVINQKLIEAEASRKSIPAEKLLEQEVDSKLGEPSDAEVKAFYLGQKDRFNRPFADIEQQLRPMLRQTKLQQARQDYLAGLREKAGVEILLRPPKTQLTYDPARLKGNTEAPVTIVEFSDFQCPYCQAAQVTLKEVLGKYDGRVKLAFRDFPLQAIHPQAQLAAEASRCAGEQSKFWDYHDWLFANPGQLNQVAMVEQARKLQLDGKRFEECLIATKFRTAVQSDFQDGTRAGVNGTPAFFINGVFLNGNQPISAFDKIIEEELAAIAPKQPKR